MKRWIVLLVLVGMLLGACVPGRPSFTFVSPVAETSAVPQSTAASVTPPGATPAPVTQNTVVPALPGATEVPPTAAPQSAQGTALPGTNATGAARQGAWQLGDQLPVDPQVRLGVLPNGLTYILRQNSQPKNRAELRLVVNAGSVMEADDQKGLAHFLEHMLFNGTCHFPKQGIQNFLESNGMRFGADLNASTGFDETEYYLRIPLDDPKVLDTGLNVLVDWASCATLDPVELNRERGVIVEEHRLRDLSAQGRIQDQTIEQLFAGSQYAQRLPIGDMNIVQNTAVAPLRRFYNDWYRPDLMAVIAVGDFDAATVEQLVRQKFGAIPARQDAPKRPAFSVPDFSGTHYLVVTDAENPSTFVQVLLKTPAQAFGTVALYRKTLVQDLFFSMLNRRYENLIRGGSAPFAAADVGRDDLVRTSGAYVLGAQTQETNTLPALTGLLTEVERVKRYGFTEAELQQAQSNLLEAYRRAYNDRSTADTSALVDEYTRHFLTGEDIPGIAVENEVAGEFVPQITLAEVNAEVQALAGTDNRFVLAVAPQKAGFTPPTEAQLASTANGLAALDIGPNGQQAAATQLITAIPQPAAVISQTTHPELGISEITLANGVHVVMKPTDFEADQILFAGLSRGGSSLLPDADVIPARLAGGIVANSGVAGFSQAQLETLLAGKSVSVSPGIRELSQRFDGSSSARDLETAFQLIYLYVTQPRLDPNAVKAVKDEAVASLTNRGLDPQSQLQDAVTKALYGDSVRWNPVPPLAAIEALDGNRAFQIYKARFANMSGFTFIFVGSFDVAQVTALAQKYLGTLPGNGKADAWRNLLPPVPAGIQAQEVHQGTDNRAEAQIIFPGAFSATPADQIQLKLIRDILRIRLIAELRQKLSATYSPNASASIGLWPEPRYQVTIDFTADPAKTKELLAATFAQIDGLRTAGPTIDELVTAKEQEKRSHEVELRQNQFWLSTLTDYTLDPKLRDPGAALAIDNQIDGVTAKDIQRAAQQFLKADRYIQVVLYPTSGQSATVYAPSSIRR